MDIAFAANRRRIAKDFGHCGDSYFNVLFRFRIIRKRLELLQRQDRQDRARPGPKIFRRESVAGD